MDVLSVTRHAVLAVCFGLAAACGGDGGGNPAAPTRTTTSVAVTFPAGGTIFIDDAVQFEARETLSDGTTRVATNVTWGSDAPAVATVSPTGLVTAVAAGEATIFADVNPRGELLIRVFPSFGGTWPGGAIIVSCEDSGTFDGLNCDPGKPFAVGDTFALAGIFTQTGDSVSAEVDYSANQDRSSTVTTTGTVSISGELRLADAESVPGFPAERTEQRNWRSRSDVPGVITGTFELLITNRSGVPGELLVSLELQDYRRTESSGTSRRSHLIKYGLEGLPSPRSRVH